MMARQQFLKFIINSYHSFKLINYKSTSSDSVVNLKAFQILTISDDCTVFDILRRGSKGVDKLE
jgi:hypothetical protein